MAKQSKAMGVIDRKAKTEGLSLIEYLIKMANPEMRDILNRMIRAELRKSKHA